MDIDNIVTDLNGKADINLANVTTTSGLRRLISSYINTTSVASTYYKIFQEYQDDGSVKYWCEQQISSSIGSSTTISLLYPSAIRCVSVIRNAETVGSVTYATTFTTEIVSSWTIYSTSSTAGSALIKIGGYCEAPTT